MRWVGLLIRVLAVIWFIVVATYNRDFLTALGFAPTQIARIIWNVTLITPVFAIAFPLAKRADERVARK